MKRKLLESATKNIGNVEEEQGISNSGSKQGFELDEILHPRMVTPFLDLVSDVQLLACSRQTQTRFGYLFASAATCRPLQAVQKYGRRGCQHVRRVVLTNPDELEVAYAYHMNITTLYLRMPLNELKTFSEYPPKGVKHLNIRLPEYISPSDFAQVSMSRWVQLQSLDLPKLNYLRWQPDWLPPNLTHLLSLTDCIIPANTFPTSLQKMTLDNYNSHYLSKTVLPRGLKHLEITIRPYYVFECLKTFDFPMSIRTLTLGCTFVNNFLLPPMLESLDIQGNCNICTSKHVLPKSLKNVTWTCCKNDNVDSNVTFEPLAVMLDFHQEHYVLCITLATIEYDQLACEEPQLHAVLQAAMTILAPHLQRMPQPHIYCSE